jgi:hypothetical protein
VVILLSIQLLQVVEFFPLSATNPSSIPIKPSKP